MNIKQRPRRLPLSLLLMMTLSGCGQGQFANPFAVHLDVSLNPAALTLAPGENKPVTVSAQDGAASVTTFSVTSQAPAGLSLIPNGRILTVKASPDLKPGTYPATVNVSVPGGSGTAELTVTVAQPATPFYDARLSEIAVTLARGAQHSIAVTVQKDPGYVGNPVVTAVTGGDAISRTIQGNTVTLAVPTSAAPGSYVLTVDVSDGRNHVLLPVTITVPSQ